MVKGSKQGNLEINQKMGFVKVTVNAKIYPLDVVLSSSYVFTEKNYVMVDGDPEKELLVELRPKDKNKSLEDIGGNFNNELINYANYAVRAIQNQRLREAIIHRVLVTNSVEEPLIKEGLVEDDVIPWESEEIGQSAEEPWFDDPEGIAIPWEEKYGDKAKKK